MSASGALSSDTHRSPTTTPSTRSATARRAGCRSSTRTSRYGARCTSTCPSLARTSKPGWRRRLPREAASSTTPTPLRVGSSPTAPATACASLPGPTDPFRLPGRICATLLTDALRPDDVGPVTHRRSDRVETRRRKNEQGASVVAPEAQVSHLSRSSHEADTASLRTVYMHPVQRRRPHVSTLVHAEPIGNSWLDLLEDPAVLAQATVVDVIDMDPVSPERVGLLVRQLEGSVRDVQERLVRGERDPVRLLDIHDDGVHLPRARVEPEHPVVAVLEVSRMTFRRSLDAVRGIGEPDGAIRLDDHVVRRVEAAPPPGLDEGRHVPIAVDLDPAASVRALDDLAGQSEGSSVGEFGVVGIHADAVIGLGPLQDPIVRDVAEPNRSELRNPHGAFGPDGVTAVVTELRVLLEQAVAIDEVGVHAATSLRSWTLSPAPNRNEAEQVQGHENAAVCAPSEDADHIAMAMTEANNGVWG